MWIMETLMRVGNFETAINPCVSKQWMLCLLRLVLYSQADQIILAAEISHMLETCAWNWPTISNFLSATLQSWQHFTIVGIRNICLKFSFPQVVTPVFLSQLLYFHLSNHLNINRNKLNHTYPNYVWFIQGLKRASQEALVVKTPPVNTGDLNRSGFDPGLEDPLGQGNHSRGMS